MKKSTLLTAALAVATLTASAQTNSLTNGAQTNNLTATETASLAKAQKALQAAHKLFSPKKAAEKAARKASKQVNTPSLTTTFKYNDGTWDYSYETEYTYDAHQNVTQTVTKSGDTYVEKYSYTYDATSPTLLVAVDHQTWNATAGSWGEAEHQLINTVTRNDDGTIKSLHIVSNGYKNETSESTINATYGSDKTLTTVDYTTTEDDETTTMTFKNIVWEQTDGDFDLTALFGDDLSPVMEGTNLIKSADVTLSADYVSIPGTFTTTYTDNGWKATMALTFSYGFYTLNMSAEYAKEYTDANGSYVYTINSDNAGDTEYEKDVVTIDEHGSTVEYVIYYGGSASDASLYGASKAEVTYDDEGRPSTDIVYYYDKTSESYVPFAKTEYEYSSADAISTVQNTTAAAQTGVYTLGGTLVSQSTDALPSGLYIVREGGKAYKMAVRR